MGILTYICVLILLYIVTRFIMRGLFDTEWRENIQEIIDSKKRERIFWNLMKGNHNFGFDLNVRGVFRFYITSLTRKPRGEDVISARDYLRQGISYDDLDKNIIKKNVSVYKNIEVLNNAIEEKEKSIEKFLDETVLTFTQEEFELYFVQYNSEWHDELVKLYHDFCGQRNTGIAVWEAMKSIKKYSTKFEFDLSGNHRVAKNRLQSLKMTEAAIDEKLISLIFEKIENKETGRKIKKTFGEWEQLHMLLWCIVNDHFAYNETNTIKITLWRIVEKIFL